MALAVLLGTRPAPTILPSEPLGPISTKLADLSSRGAEIGVVVVGSSRVLRGVLPEALDRGLEQAGCTGIRSYNFGIAGLSLPTIGRLAAALVATAPRPRLLLIEPLGAVGPALRLPNHPITRWALTPRTIPLGWLQIETRKVPGRFGRTPFPTLLRALGVPAQRSIKLEVERGYLASVLTTMLGVGRLQRRLFPPPALRFLQADLVKQQRGFLSFEDAMRSPEAAKTLRGRRLDPKADAEPFRRYLGLVLEAANETPPPTTPAQRSLLHRLLELADPSSSSAPRAGILLPPSVDPRGYRHHRAQAAHVRQCRSPRPMLLLDPRELPALQQMRAWFDRGHLSRWGAARYSAWAGRSLCAALSPEQRRVLRAHRATEVLRTESR